MAAGRRVSHSSRKGSSSGGRPGRLPDAASGPALRRSSHTFLNLPAACILLTGTKQELTRRERDGPVDRTSCGCGRGAMKIGAEADLRSASSLVSSERAEAAWFCPLVAFSEAGLQDVASPDGAHMGLLSAHGAPGRWARPRPLVLVQEAGAVRGFGMVHARGPRRSGNRSAAGDSGAGRSAERCTLGDGGGREGGARRGGRDRGRAPRARLHGHAAPLALRSGKRRALCAGAARGPGRNRGVERRGLALAGLEPAERGPSSRREGARRPALGDGTPARPHASAGAMAGRGCVVRWAV